MRSERKDDAVSPVIGVMLMLVVTLIIAAVVSVFASGLATDTTSTPISAISLERYVATEPDTYGYSYITDMTFSCNGGDVVSSTELSLTIETALSSKTWSFMELGTGVKSFGPGDKLTVHKDGTGDYSTESYGIVNQGSMDGSPINWKIVYIPTGQTLSSGSFVLAVGSS